MSEIATVPVKDIARQLLDAGTPSEVMHASKKLDVMFEAAKFYNASAEELIEISLQRVLAIRKLGELLKEMPRVAGVHFADGSTLKDFGVDRKLSSRAQKLAEQPRKVLDAYLAKCREYRQIAELNTALRYRISDDITNDDRFFASARTDEHYTPDNVIAEIKAYWPHGIDLDPCCNPGEPNIPAAQVYRKEDDGLVQPWAPARTVYINPPYSNSLPWVQRAVAEVRTGMVEEVLMLLKSSTDVEWFQEIYDYPVIFVRGRLSFKGNDGEPATFASMLVSINAWNGVEITRRTDEFASAFAALGSCWVRQQ